MYHVPGIQPPWQPRWAPPPAPGPATGGAAAGVSLAPMEWVLGGFDTAAEAIAGRFSGETLASHLEAERDGRWLADHTGSTQSSHTGPGENNELAFIHTETSSTASPATLIDHGTLVMLSTAGAQGRAWLMAPVARRLGVRCCIQGDFADVAAGGQMEGLAIEHRPDSAAEWTRAHLIAGWGFAFVRTEGETLNDYAGNAFNVVAAGGWRDVDVDIPASARELRIRPIYVAASTPGAQIYRQDVALRSVRLSTH